MYTYTIFKYCLFGYYFLAHLNRDDTLNDV